MFNVGNSYKPTFAEEEKLAAQGFRLTAGVDEAGRGCIAGPVVAAAVILPRGFKARWLEEVNDSKLLTPRKRDYLFSYISESSVAAEVGIVSHSFIDKQNILNATKLAMKQAIEKLQPQPDSLLIDFMKLPEVPLPQKGITHGDGLCFSIACASIIAKVTRDRLMVEMDGKYPGYGLCRHKGYGTREHISSLRKLGPCPIHRLSFRPVREALL